MRQYFIKLDDPDLAYFVEGTMSFHHYIEDMLWAQRYAMQSRAGMMTALLADLFRLTGKGKVQFTVNCHHNYTEREHHNGKDLWITRKGAIRARTDDLGVIPGSMGTDSYIVRGLANPASYNSAPHGAGRRMSRTQARAQITAEELTADMGSRTWNAGSVHSLRDEAPRAYKDITTVMEDSADLCKIEYKLTAVLNYKGTDEGRVKTKGHQ
jgi:tRNA-splicing ligase RtcB